MPPNTLRPGDVVRLESSGELVAGSHLARMRADWMQHWISLHVAQGWTLESVHGNIAVMVGGNVRRERLHLIVHEGGGLSYGYNNAPDQIATPRQPRWYDDTQMQVLVAIAGVVLVFAAVYAVTALAR
jgi:hypothetical protein